jgi:hypothetical protein
MKLVEIKSSTPFQSDSIDEEGKVVKNVVLLSKHSGNKELNGHTRIYSDLALTQAATLFEGASTFIDHRAKKGLLGRGNHSVANFLGTVHGVSVIGERVVAEEWRIINESHWPLVKGIAKNSPKGIGFSMDGEGKMNGNTVLGVANVKSIDLVTNPATTTSLFEEENSMEWEALKLTDLKENREDLIEELTKDLTAKVTELEEKLKATEEKKEGEEKTLQEQVEELKLQVVTGEKETALLQFLSEQKVTLSEVQLKAIRLLEAKEDQTAFVKEIVESNKSRPTSFAKSENSGSFDDKVKAAMK